MSSTRGKIDVKFGDIRFFSNFDSGNLDRVQQCQSSWEYNLWTAPDCAGTCYENGNRSWFYFGLSTPPNFCGKYFRFHLQNLNKQSRLYQQRMAPFIRITPGRGVWQRLKEQPEWEMGDEGLKLSFHYTVEGNHQITAYFSFCYPHSYLDCQHMLAKLDELCATPGKDIYYHRELLCYSLEGRRIDLITVSSLCGRREEMEPRLSGLFPDTSSSRAHQFTGKKVVVVTSRVHPGETPSSHVFNGFLDFILREKDARAKAVRQHFVVKMIPMLNPDGVAHGHYRTDICGVNLNRVYLNPDPQLHPSVYGARSIVLYHHKTRREVKRATSVGKKEIIEEDNGLLKREREHSRERLRASSVKTTHELNTTGLILDERKRPRSRTYPLELKENIKCTYPVRHHTVLTDCVPARKLDITSSGSESKELIAHDVIAQNSSGIALYVDLHAHATKRGCFFYGNYITDLTQQVENMLYAKLVTLNSPHLDFDHCVFSEKNMYSTDRRDGLSKEGSGRVALHKATGIVHCYTLECNYNSGRQSNAVNAVTCDEGRVSPPLPYSNIPYLYSITTYQQVGKALAIALLDQYSLNPWPRFHKNEVGTLVALRSVLKTKILNSTTRMSCPRSLHPLFATKMPEDKKCLLSPPAIMLQTRQTRTGLVELRENKKHNRDKNIYSGPRRAHSITESPSIKNNIFPSKTQVQHCGAKPEVSVMQPRQWHKKSRINSKRLLPGRASDSEKLHHQTTSLKKVGEAILSDTSLTEGRKRKKEERKEDKS